MWRQSITNITNFKKNVYGNQEANGTRTTLYMYYFYYAFILIFMFYFCLCWICVVMSILLESGNAPLHRYTRHSQIIRTK